MAKVFIKELGMFPEELLEILPMEQIPDDIYNSICHINELVDVEDYGDYVDVKFIKGSHTFQVLNFSLITIEEFAKVNAPEFFLKVVEIFHLGLYLNLDEKIEEYKAIA